MSLISELTGYLTMARSARSTRSGVGLPLNLPPTTTPSTVVYEGGRIGDSSFFVRSTLLDRSVGSGRRRLGA